MEALGSGGYPYKESLKEKAYLEELRVLQIELVKLQKWANDTGQRIVLLLEGRDAAYVDHITDNLTGFLAAIRALN